MSEDKSVIYEDENHYISIEKQIGKGSFAKVYKGYYNTVSSDTTNVTKQLVAIKEIDSSLLNTNNRKQQQVLLNNLEVEITILKKLIHENIVKLITTTIEKDSKKFIIVMEYCNLGDLAMLIRVNKNVSSYSNGSSMFINLEHLLTVFPKNKYGGINHILLYSFIKQLAAGLKFIRSRNLIHRDIKPQNLILSSSSLNSKPPTLKIADFGFARFLPSQSMAETLCGSPQWMAPEILSYKKYDEKVDLWSSGAVIYEMCFGKPAYSARNYMELLKKIKTVPLAFPKTDSSYKNISGRQASNDDSDYEEDEYSDSSEEDDDVLKRKKVHFDDFEILNKEMRNLIKRLLTYDPEKRMSFDEFFKDPVVAMDLDALIRSESQKEIKYNDVFYEDSDDEDDKSNQTGDINSFTEADGYLMIDNDAIKTASEYPINDRRKSSASSRRSSFAGMTRAITKAFRSASQSSATSSTSKNNTLMNNNNENSPLSNPKTKLKKLPEHSTLTQSQFYDLTTTLSERLEKQTNQDSIEFLTENRLEREKAKLHILQTVLKQEDSPEWRLQLEIRLLDYITKLMNFSTILNKDVYINDSFDLLVLTAEEDYCKMKSDTTLNAQPNERPENFFNQSQLDQSGQNKDTLWPNEAIVDLLWQHISKFGRISLQLEKSGQLGAACMGYASMLWLLDYILFDLLANDSFENKDKFLRMVTLTIGRLRGIY